MGASDGIAVAKTGECDPSPLTWNALAAGPALDLASLALARFLVRPEPLSLLGVGVGEQFKGFGVRVRMG